MELTIIMPCLNEAETIGTCISKAQSFLTTNKIVGEIVIGDNGSTDGSIEIAEHLGARVVSIETKGYGAALMGAIQSAKGQFIIMADSDDSYDFEHLEDFVLRLRGGSDLVMGNRFKGGIEPGAMPFLHKFLGNPVLSFLGRLFFNIKIGDFHCGLRGFNREKILRLKLKTTGMEFASEMIVKSAQYNYSITEIPTKLKQDGRSRPPHLNTWRDGWRHLRFLLMAAPNWLFLLPGLLFCFTSLLSLFFIPNFCQLLNLKEQQFIMSTVGMFIVGFQMIVFYFFAKIFTITQGIVPTTNRYMNLFKYFNLERGLLFSVFLIISGICTIIYLDTRTLLNWHVGLLEIVLGLQLILNSFMFSIIGTVKKEQIQ